MAGEVSPMTLSRELTQSNETEGVSAYRAQLQLGQRRPGDYMDVYAGRARESDDDSF